MAAAAACSSQPPSPEERVRATLAALEAAAEARDVGAMKEHVSERYRDERGHDRRAVAGMVAMHLMQNRSVHLLTRVREVAISRPGEADVLVLVAMAGTPIASADALPSLRADLYRFELALAEEDGEWRVTGADWSPATLEDFR